jgi:hypothetical protein
MQAHQLVWTAALAHRLFRDGRLARGAEPEQLDSMAVDTVAGPPLDLGDDGRHAQSLEVHGTLAAGANEVVVMAAGVAADVRMLTVGEIESLDGAQTDEDFERPEDRCPGHPQAAPPRVGHEVGRLESPVPPGDQGRYCTARLCRPVPRVIERPDQLCPGRIASRL